MKFEVALQGFDRFKQFIKGLNQGKKDSDKLKDNMSFITQELQRREATQKKATESFKPDGKAVEAFNKDLNKTRSTMLGIVGLETWEHHAKQLKAFRAQGVAAFGNIGKAAKAAWVSLGPWALALGAIALLVKVIKQAFKWNIGGIMGTWKKGVGEFRAALGKLQLATYKLFKVMAPIFKVIGGILLFVLKVVTKLIEGITALVNLLSGNKSTLAGLGGYGSGGATTNNNNNVTVITNQPINEKSARGFQETLNNSTFR